MEEQQEKEAEILGCSVRQECLVPDNDYALLLALPSMQAESKLDYLIWVLKTDLSPLYRRAILIEIGRCYEEQNKKSLALAHYSAGYNEMKGPMDLAHFTKYEKEVYWFYEGDMRQREGQFLEAIQAYEKFLKISQPTGWYAVAGRSNLISVIDSQNLLQKQWHIDLWLMVTTFLEEIIEITQSIKRPCEGWEDKVKGAMVRLLELKLSMGAYDQAEGYYGRYNKIISTIENADYWLSLISLYRQETSPIPFYKLKENLWLKSDQQDYREDMSFKDLHHYLSIKAVPHHDRLMAQCYLRAFHANQQPSDYLAIPFREKMKGALTAIESVVSMLGTMAPPREIQDQLLLADCRHTLGVSYYFLGDALESQEWGEGVDHKGEFYTRAATYLEEALRVRDNLENQVLTGVLKSHAYHMLGSIYERTNDAPKAAMYFASSLKHQEPLGKYTRVGAKRLLTLEGLIDLYEGLKSYKYLTHILKDELKLSLAFWDDQTVYFDRARLLSHLGTAYKNNGKYTKAKIYFKKALAVIDSHTGIPSLQGGQRALVLAKIGMVNRELFKGDKKDSHLAKAHAYLKKANLLFAKCGCEYSQNYFETRMLYIVTKQSMVGCDTPRNDNFEDYHRIIGLYKDFVRRGTALQREGGPWLWKDVISAYNNMGLIYAKLNLIPKAEKYLLKALDFKAPCGERPVVQDNQRVLILNDLATIYFERENWGKAEFYYRLVLSILEGDGTLQELQPNVNNYSQMKERLKYVQEKIKGLAVHDQEPVLSPGLQPLSMYCPLPMSQPSPELQPSPVIQPQSGAQLSPTFQPSPVFKSLPMSQLSPVPQRSSRSQSSPIRPLLPEPQLSPMIQPAQIIFHTCDPRQFNALSSAEKSLLPSFHEVAFAHPSAQDDYVFTPFPSLAGSEKSGEISNVGSFQERFGSADMGAGERKKRQRSSTPNRKTPSKKEVRNT